MSHPLEKVCPRCGVPAGQKCLGSRGHERKAFHRERGSKRNAHAVYSVDDLVTESPIEKLLAGSIRGWLAHNDLPDISVRTQVPIGPFRADILIEVGQRKLVVECDGAGFHNGRDQVERDKRRDRYCVANGYSVMRFTGSEIQRDCRGCAAEVGIWIMR